MADYLDILSDFVADTRYDGLSAEALAAIRDVTLDTLGDSGMLATLVNATAGVALEMDEGNR